MQTVLQDSGNGPHWLYVKEQVVCLHLHHCWRKCLCISYSSCVVQPNWSVDPCNRIRKKIDWAKSGCCIYYIEVKQFMWILFCYLCFTTVLSVPCSFVTTCWQRADPLAVLRVMFLCFFDMPIRCLWSVVVLNCIDSWSLPSSILLSFPNIIISFSLKVDFDWANSADPDEMPHYAAFHLGPSLFAKVPVYGFWFSKG